MVTLSRLFLLSLGPADCRREGQRWEALFPSPHSSPQQGSAPGEGSDSTKKGGRKKESSAQWLPVVRKQKLIFFFLRPRYRKKLKAVDCYTLEPLLRNSWC